MYTLFGNDLAVQYAHTNPQHDYPAGSVLSLVTWSQQEDPRCLVKTYRQRQSQWSL